MVPLVDTFKLKLTEGTFVQHHQTLATCLVMEVLAPAPGHNNERWGEKRGKKRHIMC